MTSAIHQFERACQDAGVSPVAALAAGGLSRATWYRWKAGTASPTLRSLEAAQSALATLAQQSASRTAA